MGPGGWGAFSRQKGVTIDLSRESIMSMGGYAASLTGVSGGAAPQSSSESSLSRWAALDDLGRRSIVEYMDVESLGGTDRAMTSKVDREEWIRALRGIKRTFLEQYMNKWFRSWRFLPKLRWYIKRGIVVEGLRDGQ